MPIYPTDYAIQSPVSTNWTVTSTTATNWGNDYPEGEEFEFMSGISYQFMDESDKHFQ